MYNEDTKKGNNINKIIYILLTITALFGNDIIQKNSKYLQDHHFKDIQQLNKFNGDVTESMMSKYFKGSGWGQISGEVGVNGIDGLFIKKDKKGNIKDILTVESKYNKSQLGHIDKKSITKSRQMSKRALLKQIDKNKKDITKRIAKSTSKSEIDKLKIQFKEYQQIKYRIWKDNYRARLFKMKPTDVKGEFKITIDAINQKGFKDISISKLKAGSKYKAHNIIININKKYSKGSYQSKLQKQLKSSITETKSIRDIKKLSKQSSKSSKALKGAIPIVFMKKGKKVVAFMSGNAFKESGKLTKKIKFLKNVKGGDIVMMAITSGTVVYSVLKGGASFKALSGVLLSNSTLKSIGGFGFEKGIAYLAPPPAIIITIVGSIALDYAIDKYVELNKRNYIGIEDLLWDVPDEVKNRITVLNLEDIKRETIFDFEDIDKDTILDDEVEGETILDDESLNDKESILDY